MRGGGGSGNNVLETISAAATAIVSADDRLHHASPVRKKQKWWSRWSISICFGISRQKKRIGNAVLAPEPMMVATISSNSSITTGYHPRPSVIALPFVAPPSSPASFFQSEPPSATQSPVGIVSFSPIPNNGYYSPCGRPSIFAIGPYAHETQLVSPPVFSTYTTEPSSAPITPPPESIHLTTPSSPEVPFAQLFNSTLRSGNYCHRFPVSNNYEFQFYQLPPGSPLGQLISPRSVVSGSGPTSPFPDGEGSLRFPQFQLGEPPKLLSPDKLHYSRTSTTPSKDQQTTVRPRRPVGHGASFDLDSDHVIRCVDQKLRTTFPEASTVNPSATENPEVMNGSENLHHQSSSLGSNKEFNFGTDEKHLTIDDEHRASMKNNWSFFPVVQPGTIS